MSASNTTQGRKVPVQFDPPMEDVGAAQSDHAKKIEAWEMRVRAIASNLGSTGEVSPAIVQLTLLAREMERGLA